MKIKTFFSKVLPLLVLISILACDEEVPVVNTNDLNPNILFQSLDQVDATVNASYGQLQTLYQRNGYIFPDAFSDEMVSSGDPSFAPFFRFELNASLENIARYWTACFNGIGACNFVISNEERMLGNVSTSNFTEADVADAIGQALFLRAQYYYFLVKRFGGVPLKLDFDTALNDDPRDTADAVYDQIIADLIRSSQLTLNKGATEVGRVTSGAAYSLLGKVYLHREMFTEAQEAFNNVVDYSLLPLEEYADNFNESGEYNDESIFEVGFNGELGTEAERWGQNGVGTSEQTFHSQEYTGWGNLRPSGKLMDEFEVDDPRREVATLDDGQSYGPNGMFTAPSPGSVGSILWYKFSQLYEQESVGENSGVNARIIRFADVVLMKAEVELNLGNDAMAIAYLNQIRERVRLPLYGTPEMDGRGFPVNTPEAIFNAIVHERFVELCGEQVRFDDLIRWDLDAEELDFFPDDNGNDRAYNPAIHRVMPIPQNEIDTNTMLNSENQNTGY